VLQAPMVWVLQLMCGCTVTSIHYSVPFWFCKLHNQIQLFNQIPWCIIYTQSHSITQCFSNPT